MALRSRPGRDAGGVALRDVLSVGVRRVVLRLDEEPLRRAVLLRLHPLEMEAAGEALAEEVERQRADGEALVGVLAVGHRPGAAVPQHHRTAAIFAGGDGALEAAIVDRVVLGLDSEALVGGVEARPARHRPRLQDAVVLEAEIVVEAPRVVLLDHERGRRLRLALCGGAFCRRWLARAGEIPLLLVALQRAGHVSAARSARRGRLLRARRRLLCGRLGL